jgi:hypothetical protein
MFFFTGKNKHKLRDISLRSGFAALGWSTVARNSLYPPYLKAESKVQLQGGYWLRKAPIRIDPL